MTRALAVAAGLALSCNATVRVTADPDRVNVDVDTRYGDANVRITKIGNDVGFLVFVPTPFGYPMRGPCSCLAEKP